MGTGLGPLWVFGVLDTPGVILRGLVFLQGDWQGGFLSTALLCLTLPSPRPLCEACSPFSDLTPAPVIFLPSSIHQSPWWGAGYGWCPPSEMVRLVLQLSKPGRGADLLETAQVVGGKDEKSDFSTLVTPSCPFPLSFPTCQSTRNCASPSQPLLPR